jgi:hypothetical protein
MGTFMIRKMKAARTRIRGCKGHYMGLKIGLFFEIGGYKGPDFQGEELDGFTGVFLGRTGRTGVTPITLDQSGQCIPASANLCTAFLPFRQNREGIKRCLCVTLPASIDAQDVFQEPENNSRIFNPVPRHQIRPHKKSGLN